MRRDRDSLGSAIYIDAEVAWVELCPLDLGRTPGGAGDSVCTYNFLLRAHETCRFAETNRNINSESSLGTLSLSITHKLASQTEKLPRRSSKSVAVRRPTLLSTFIALFTHSNIQHKRSPHMPAITPNSRILVSGASGFIATWTCQLLLERGFEVRGTVRSEEKGEYLSGIFKQFGDRWSYVLVGDITAPGAFDEAIKDIDGVAHLASPFHFHSTDPLNDILKPAIEGTLSVLKSANGPNGRSVKRIVITSSFGAITHPPLPDSSDSEESRVLTESDWNEHCPKVLMEQGAATPAFVAYCASKTLAEKAAWQFVKENKPAFDLVTICPPFNFGPVIHQVKNAKSLNTSVKLFYEYLVGSGDIEALKHPAGYVVDVRDVATAHIQAMVIEQAGGNRYGVSERSFAWQDALDVLHDNGHGKYWPQAPRGTPGMGKVLSAKQDVFDTSKVMKELGLKYRPFESTILDMSLSLHALAKKWDAQS